MSEHNDPPMCDACGFEADWLQVAEVMLGARSDEPYVLCPYCMETPGVQNMTNVQRQISCGFNLLEHRLVAALDPPSSEA